ncbi:MAG: hypothetical protein CME22_05780 [Gemmatimonadetes bacterium]|nr:hypothetical protein [Gemmatimonadota bacterium]|tara:strand:+ start:847 stop:1518 length:672 start_codon:yes stop_codon:yes gene_type:complete
MSESAGQYFFKEGVSCLFEIPTDNARRLLPKHLQPVERRPESSVLSVSAFDFHAGDAGQYQELVLAILVPPLVKKGEPLPKAALYPFMVGTSTQLGRDQGIERWKLPHFPQDINVTFSENNSSVKLKAEEEGAPILELTVTQHIFAQTELLFHSFMSDPQGDFKADITMRGELYSEHEFEMGSLVLFDHEMTRGLAVDEVACNPFREQWMRNGVEVFSPLQRV